MRSSLGSGRGGRTGVRSAATHGPLAEARALARLGAPMAATQFFIMAMGFMDTAMAGHYASAHLAGVAVGGNVLWPVYLLFAGCTMSVTPIAAQLTGGGRIGQVGAVVHQALVIGVAASVLGVLVLLNAAPLFALFGIDAEATDVGYRYLRATALGLPAGICYIVLRHASEGVGRTVGPMVIAGVALLLNAGLNYALIYGRFGAPELGGEGCGWATAAVMWFELGAILVLSRARYFRETGLWRLGATAGARAGLDFREIGRILRIGVPIGLTSFVGMALFAIIGFLVGSLGVVPLAAHSIATHINWATFVAPMALGAAAGIRIGFYVGAGDYPGAARVGRVAFVIALCYALTVSVALVLFRYDVVAVYSSDSAVTGLVAALILVIAVYQVFDDAQATMAGALRGYKDTRAPLVYSLLGYWGLALPLGAALGFGWWRFPELGVYGFWIALSLGLAAVSTAVGLRLYHTSRKPERIALLAR